MRTQLAYDLPLRIFHWLFAGLFILAFLIAKNIDSESPTYTYHMLAGLLLGFTVLLRILWGFIGTKYSRFSSFALSPKEVISYFVGMISGDKRKWLGHNPASSWSALIMMALALSLGVTGLLMTSGEKEAFEDIHELLANSFLIVVLLHIAGVFLHLFRHRDGIVFSMVDGKKMEAYPSTPILSSKRTVALFFVVLVLAFAGYLIENFDQQNRTLNFFGKTLQLGEVEN